ncbi:MAG: HlyD family efflux transporter periplasmic adaptor subunit [Glaciimonas sp.]|nr:HlyD family efflux transporter periplasmic adaptor subunit [Glaciimonas sp.]
MLGFVGLAAALAACTEPPSGSFPGYAEADYVRVSTPIAGTLLTLHFKKGDQAKRGAPAFVLEQISETAARAEAAFRVQSAAASLANLKKGKRPDEIATAQAQLAQAQAAQRLSAADLVRQTQLIDAHFISAARLDEARAAVMRDQARVRELQAQLRVQQLGARSDEITVAEQALNAAQAQLAQVAWRVAQKSPVIPVDSAVAEVLYQEGEWVPAGGSVLSLLPPQNIKARFFVPETLLGKLHLGQTVELRCDGCSAAIAATVSFIAHDAEYTAPLIYSKENRASLVFMVEARPDLKNAYLLHPGQPLEVRLVGAASQSQQ